MQHSFANNYAFGFTFAFYYGRRMVEFVCKL